MSTRREFIMLLGGAAAAWPLAARAQQGQGMRRVGVVMNVAESDEEGQANVTAFVQRLKELGWTDDRNLHLDIRWGAGDRVRTGNMQGSWSHSRQTPFSPSAALSWLRCNRRPARCRS
jgi:hypothetical protein